MDKTYAAALELAEPSPPPRHRRSPRPKSKLLRNTRTKKAKSKQPTIVGPPTFSFHKEYVDDVSEIIKGEKDRKKQTQKVMRKFAAIKKDRNGMAGWTMQTFPQLGVGYILPPARKLDNNAKKPSIGFRLVRSVVLGTFNDFIFLQEIENKKARANRRK